ncbi:bifunctional riboflavin kinase/FAD synthetase [Helcococcus kunzii]|uniref:bifunctional riboflavin kinase/FAD synthetase n=1 Tax=Helcococcus kunzii TaxID=40091 RepID=UPI0024AD4C7D|nr:bifunctional riboflavin kinase/FAD synthetase [Helcococcus kunzii]
MSRVIDLDIEKFNFDRSVIGLGNFDGFHIGHREVIKKVIEISKKENIKSSVLVFKQHTNEVFPHFPRYYISSLQDKIDTLTKLGIDYIFIIDFTIEFAQLSNEEFILDFIKDSLNADILVCGPDYTFGKLSKGKVKELYQYQAEKKIKVYIQDYVKDGNRKVSSTTIRNLIQNGQVNLIKDLLGDNYTITGEVIHGYKIGSRELGYPTANIKLNFRYIMPGEGVYLTYVYYNDKKYLSLTSIGTNPTVTDNLDIKLEVYIIDFNKEIYGETLKIEFIEKIRNQVKFDTKQELIKQMDSDYQFAINYFK